MRKFITGTNPDGRSCIVEESDVTPGPVPGIDKLTLASLWNTDQSPPPARPEQTGHFIDIRLPGWVRWRWSSTRRPRGRRETARARCTTRTRSTSIVVIEGSTQMILDDDVRDLVAGDCVVMTGVDHALKAGPDGSPRRSPWRSASRPPS